MCCIAVVCVTMSVRFVCVCFGTLICAFVFMCACDYVLCVHIGCVYLASVVPLCVVSVCLSCVCVLCVPLCISVYLSVSVYIYVYALCTCVVWWYPVVCTFVCVLCRCLWVVSEIGRAHV